MSMWDRKKICTEISTPRYITIVRQCLGLDYTEEIPEDLLDKLKHINDMVLRATGDMLSAPEVIAAIIQQWRDDNYRSAMER